MSPDRRALFSRKLTALKQELGSTQLLIVSKHRSPEDIALYYELGQRDFGENRVQELAEKAALLRERCPEIRWHMIGHLQSNKIKELFSVPNLCAIHSVDDQELLEKLQKHSPRLAAPVDLFLQFKTSGEAEKSGFETYQSLSAAAHRLSEGGGQLRLAGLMTMGPIRTDDFERDTTRAFELLRETKEKLSRDLGLPLRLSMGMSQDYQIALRLGSDWVRIGTMLFEG